VIDSSPVECARFREAVHRSELAGWAEYGYCASHSRYFWGLRLHLLATLHGLPIGFALTGAKADERTVLLDILHTDPTLHTHRPGQVLIGEKNYFGAEFETTLAETGLNLLQPAWSAPRFPDSCLVGYFMLRAVGSGTRCRPRWGSCSRVPSGDVEYCSGIRCTGQRLSGRVRGWGRRYG
jgi:hypothetical protein